MRITRRCLGNMLGGVVIALGPLMVVTAAHAQSYPSRPIKIVVPFGSGAAADVATRRIAVSLATVLGQPVIIENRAGAGGSIGADYVAKSAADGYTLLAGTINTHAFNPGLYQHLAYDPARNFEPISRFVSFANVLVVPNKLGVSTVAGLVEAAERAPSPLSFSSMGTGQSGHLAGELLAKGIGKPLLHVAYKDVGQYVPDTIDGRVDLSFVNIPTFLPYIQAGKIKALAVSSQKRSSLLPDVPTLDEAGLKNQEMNLWVGLFAPQGTPVAILTKLNEAVRKAATSPEVIKGAEDDGSQIDTDGSPEAFRSFVDEELARWKNVMAAAGIKPQ